MRGSEARSGASSAPSATMLRAPRCTPRVRAYALSRMPLDGRQSRASGRWLGIVAGAAVRVEETSAARSIPEEAVHLGDRHRGRDGEYAQAGTAPAPRRFGGSSHRLPGFTSKGGADHEGQPRSGHTCGAGSGRQVPGVPTFTGFVGGAGHRPGAHGSSARRQVKAQYIHCNPRRHTRLQLRIPRRIRTDN